MDCEDFFHESEKLIESSKFDQDFKEIYFRTAINRLYYGIFHFVQRELRITIPQEHFRRCHLFVKERIESLPIYFNYAALEELRNRSDYDIVDLITKNDYLHANKLKEHIVMELTGEGTIPYDKDDEIYFNRFKDEDW
ncbi:MAG: hypothetical protein ACFFCS_20420 [Candidatus Hodarchaeota archaeon]